MIEIQLLSDLHLEAPAAYDIYEIPPAAPYLALLGDIGYTRDDGLFAFLRRQLSHFQIVFFVLGNHEAYYSSLRESKARLRTLQADTERATDQAQGKFVFLDQTRYDLSPEVTLLGCTLFTQIPAAQAERVSFGLNDFYLIDDWSVEQHVEQHEADVRWLDAELAKLAAAEPARRVLILTHHSPSTDDRAVTPRYRSSDISSGFRSDLSAAPCFVAAPLAVWAFGHTHYNCDFVDEATRVRLVSNQRGYYFVQAEGFSPIKTIVL